MQSNDIIGSICSVSLAVLGTVLPVVDELRHLPPIVIETMQLLSYTGGTIIAGITIYKHCKNTLNGINT